MKTVAIVGKTGKGPINLPVRIESIKDLHLTFGKNSNLVTIAEFLLYNKHFPIIVRVEDFSSKAGAGLPTRSGEKYCVYSDSRGETGYLTKVKITEDSITVFNANEEVEHWGKSAYQNINTFSKWIKVDAAVDDFVPGTYDLIRLGNRCHAIGYLEFLVGLKQLEDIDVELIAVPDCLDANRINELSSYIEEKKQGAMLLINPPVDYELFDTYKWCSDIKPTNYATLFWPWLKAGDKFVSPIAPSLVCLLESAFPWSLGNHRLAGVDRLKFKPHRDEVAYLSKRENFINVIKQGQGLYLDKQIKTLAGERLEDRRLLGYIKAEIVNLGKQIISTSNIYNDSFRDKFIKSAEYILDQVKEDGGIINYEVQLRELNKLEDHLVVINLVNAREFFSIEFNFREADYKYK